MMNATLQMPRMFLMFLMGKIDGFFNQSKFLRALQLAIMGALISFTAAKAGILPQLLMFGRFSVCSFLLRKKWKELNLDVLKKVGFSALYYAGNPTGLFTGVFLLGPLWGSIIGTLAYSALPYKMALLTGDKTAIRLNCERGRMNAVAFSALLFSTALKLGADFLSGAELFKTTLAIGCIIAGVFSFALYMKSLQTTVGQKVNGTRIDVDLIIFVAALICMISFGVILICQFLTGSFIILHHIGFWFFAVSILQGSALTIWFQRRLDEAKKPENCGLVGTSAFGSLMPVVGTVLAGLFVSFSWIHSAVAVIVAYADYRFIESDEFQGEKLK